MYFKKTRYRRIRSGLRGVREETCTLFSILSSSYHMSARQIEGAICEVSNILFGRKFKPYSPNSTIDAFTLPAMVNNRRTGMSLHYNYVSLDLNYTILRAIFSTR